MFGAIWNVLMAPVNFFRKTFGWLPEDVTEEDAEALQEATEANGGPSASTFAALRRSSFDDESTGSASGSATSFDGAVKLAPSLITAEDWQTLSMAQIDAKLVANGERAIGDAGSDPFYNLTPQEVDALTDAEFEALMADFEYDAFSPPVWEGILTDDDWMTLSMAQIDAKLEAAGVDPIGSPLEDPFYALTPAAVDALSDDEYFAMIDAFGWGPQYLPAWGDALAPSDLETLSPAEIDAKLAEAGFAPIGQSASPFYNLTPEDIQLLPDTALEQLLDEEAALYESLGYSVNVQRYDDLPILNTGTTTTTSTGASDSSGGDLAWLA